MKLCIATLILILVVVGGEVAADEAEQPGICGWACLDAVVAHFNGAPPAISYIEREAPPVPPLSLAAMIPMLQEANLSAIGVSGVSDFAPLIDNDCIGILHVRQNEQSTEPDHFVVLLRATETETVVADPGEGIRTLSRSQLDALRGDAALLVTLPAQMEQVVAKVRPASILSSRLALGVLAVVGVAFVTFMSRRPRLVTR